ncbi:MAG: hypothetical protein EXR75_00730 [Myxococcales bacterium]|nr:hypothetical protein [Myxococcales bacterium]
MPSRVAVVAVVAVVAGAGIFGSLDARAQVPPPSGLRAGGLTAPPPIAAEHAAAATPTEKLLDDSAAGDSGRGLSWFWLDVEGGFQRVGLETFEVDASSLTAGFSNTEASGGYVGAGFGAQLLFLRIGPRGRVGLFSDWQLFEAGGELGLRFPLGSVEPHVELGAGYAALGSWSTALDSVAESVKISGYYARIGGGLDLYLGKVFYVGATASWELLGLTRPGVALTDLDPATAASISDAQKLALAAEGSSYGSAIHIAGKLGLSF